MTPFNSVSPPPLQWHNAYLWLPQELPEICIGDLHGFSPFLSSSCILDGPLPSRVGLGLRWSTPLHLFNALLNLNLSALTDQGYDILGR